MTNRLLLRITSIPGWAQLVCGVVLIVFYAQRMATIFHDTGLFRRLGFDWGLFYSQAAALAAGDVGAMYNLDRLAPYLQRLAPYTAAPDVPLLQWPAPYPPLLASVIAPLTWLTPPLAFGIWSALSLLATAHLVWRASQLLPRAGRLRLALITLTALPIVQVFVVGQPMLFLASALAESYLALRRGADLRGGLWLGLLALKPQYGLVLGLFLLWRRRWAAVAGTAIGVAVVVLGSVVVAGPGALFDYEATVSAMGDFRDPYANAAEMVNWRALIVNLRPGIGSSSGVLVFLILSAVTVVAVLSVTRGPWRPSVDMFDLQFGVALVATFLVSYHSHMHGMALLVVPLAGVWRAANTLTRLSLLALVFVPTIAFALNVAAMHRFAINYDEPLWIAWPLLSIFVLLASLGALVWQLAPARSTAVAKQPLRVAPNP